MARTRKNTAIKLDANLDIAHAGEMLESAKEWRVSDKPLQLNASAVERVSTAAIQILLALCVDRAADGHETTIKSASDTLTTAIADLKLTPHFEEYIHG